MKTSSKRVYVGVCSLVLFSSAWGGTYSNENLLADAESLNGGDVASFTLRLSESDSPPSEAVYVKRVSILKRSSAYHDWNWGATDVTLREVNGDTLASLSGVLLEPSAAQTFTYHQGQASFSSSWQTVNFPAPVVMEPAKTYELTLSGVRATCLVGDQPLIRIETSEVAKRLPTASALWSASEAWSNGEPNPTCVAEVTPTAPMTLSVNAEVALEGLAVKGNEGSLTLVMPNRASRFETAMTRVENALTFVDGEVALGDVFLAAPLTLAATTGKTSHVDIAQLSGSGTLLKSGAGTTIVVGDLQDWHGALTVVDGDLDLSRAILPEGLTITAENASSRISLLSPDVSKVKVNGGTLEVVKTPVVKLGHVQLAYNYCTLSYTMALWLEAEWTAEIERLANAGFTHVLVNAGMEAVWYDFLTHLSRVASQTSDGRAYFSDYTDAEARAFIPHPAWRAWWLMGNLEGEGEALSPDGCALSRTDIKRQQQIGRAIINACRAHGLTPVVNGFMGLLPTNFDQKYRSLSYLPQTTGWSGYTRPDQLNPTDPHFAALAKAYYTSLFEVYGLTASDAVAFSGDLFHEGGATPKEASMITASAKAVQDAMKAARPEAIWFLQHWQENPRDALILGCDYNQTIIQSLDKNMTPGATPAPLNENYGVRTYPQKNEQEIPWIWAEVTNFGDRPNLYGCLKRMQEVKDFDWSTLPFGDRNCIGWAMLDEGLSYQKAYYAQMFDILGTWASDAVKPAELELATREETRDAWAYLLASVYQPTARQEGCTEGILYANPYKGIACGCASEWGRGNYYYDTEKVRSAARLLLEALKADPQLADDKVFTDFYVDVMRQVVSDRFTILIHRKKENLIAHRAELQTLVRDVDELLAYTETLRLDSVWALAQALATNDGVYDEATALRHYRNFYCLITSWRQDNLNALDDYSCRMLAGMMEDYYWARWEMYADGATEVEIKARDISYWKTAVPPTDLTPSRSLVALGESILGPATVTWIGTADVSSWEDANWQSEANGATIEWEPDSNVVFRGAQVETTASSPATVNNLEVSASSYGSRTTPYIPTGEGVNLGWKGYTIADLANAQYSGLFAGDWIKESHATNASLAVLPCSAYAIAESADGKSVTMQFQVDHLGNIKVVAIRLTLHEDGSVWASHEWATYRSNTSATLGDVFTDDHSSASGGVHYALRGIAMEPLSTVTIHGPVAVQGTITLHEGATLSIPELTTVPNIKVTGATATLVLGETQKVTLQSTVIPAESKLIIKGTESMLWDAASEAQAVYFTHADGTVYTPVLGSVVYVCTTPGDPNEGIEQLLTVDETTGAAKRILSVQSMPESVWIQQATMATGWSDITLDELATMQFSAKMGGAWVNRGTPIAVRGYHVSREGDAVVVEMQGIDDGQKSVKLVLTREGEEIKIRLDSTAYRAKGALGDALPHTTGSGNIATDASGKGYGICGLTVTPAVARVEALGANYADIAEAVAAAKKTTADPKVLLIYEPVSLDNLDLTGLKIVYDATGKVPALVKIPVNTKGRSVVKTEPLSDAVAQMLLKARHSGIRSITDVVVNGSAEMTLPTHTSEATHLFTNIVTITPDENIPTQGVATIAYDFGIERFTIRRLNNARMLVLKAKVNGTPEADFADGTEVHVYKKVQTIENGTAVETLTPVDGATALTATELNAIGETAGIGELWLKVPYDNVVDAYGTHSLVIKAENPNL